MPQTKLNPIIIKKIRTKTGLAESTIRQQISILRADFPSCTINAVAQLFARQKGFSVMQKLSRDDKLSLPNNEVMKSKVKIEKKKTIKKEKIIEIVSFETDNYFIKGHINEINRAYSKGCFTSTYILARKIIENMILDLLIAKYPEKTKENISLYYDISHNRTKDFSLLLKNLLEKKDDFGIEKSKVIERFYQRAKNFKDDANDKTHSWYHLVESKSEIDELKIQAMIELIKKIKE
jgi:hypothetical protein